MPKGDAKKAAKLLGIKEKDVNDIVQIMSANPKALKMMGFKNQAEGLKSIDSRLKAEKVQEALTACGLA